MNINRFISVLLLFTVAVSSCVEEKHSKQNNRTCTFPYSNPENLGVSVKKLTFLKNEINSWVDSGELIGGEVLIIKDNQTIFHESFGWFDKELDKKMDKEAVYHTSSMSKPFSTTLILQLAEQGVFSLDDPVQKFISNFPNDSVTIKNLMNHTSGYTGWGPDGANHENLKQFKSLSDWIISWTALGPNIPVGVHHYTNYNNAALMLIAEEATGKPAKRLTEEYILKPLNLRNTHVYPIDQQVNQKIPPLYKWSNGKRAYEKIDNFDELNWPAYPGAFGIFSTTEDYALFMNYWMNRGSYRGYSMLTEESIMQAFSNSNPNIFERDSTKKYGFGWRFTPSDIESIPIEFNHGGIMRSYAIAFPAENTIAIYSTHSWKQRSHREAFIKLIWRLGLLDIPPSPDYVRARETSVKFKKLCEAEAEKYCGTYFGQYEDGYSVNVKIGYDDGQLVNRITYSDSSISDINYLSFVDGTTAHTATVHNHESIWFNPKTEIRFLKKKGLITGYKVISNGKLEIELLKVKDSH